MSEEMMQTSPFECPAWFDGKKINETVFCEEFLRDYPMVTVNDAFFTVNGRVHDENRLKKVIYVRIKYYVTSGVAKKVTNLLDVMRMECCTAKLSLYQDRIHVANGTYYLNGTFSPQKDFCRNRLPVSYNPEAPQLIYPEHPLYSVDGVFNAILVKGNMVGDVMFYGQGAGKLATASAVVSDVMDAAKHAGVNIITLWDAEKLDLVAAEDARNVFFVRVSGIKAQKSEKVKELFGNVKMVDAGYDDEFAFVTEEMSEGDYEKAAAQLDGVINKIRVDQTGLA